MARGDVNADKAPYIPKTEPAPGSHIGHAVAVLSGKGGVGKSFTSSYLAVSLQRKGYKVGILDADITGPSIPYAFGVKGPILGTENFFYPAKSKTGIQIISSNLLLNSPDQPIVWRGPMISTLVEQFYNEVIWDVDYLLIDMPPGTSDVSLTIFQKIPLSSCILVSTPQTLVDMIVEKSAQMAELLSVPLLSYVENMAYVVCPDCGKKIDIYGSNSSDIAKKHGIYVYEQIPFDSNITEHMDAGDIESLDAPYLEETVEEIINVSNIE